MEKFLAFASLPEQAFLFFLSFVLGAFVGIQKDILWNFRKTRVLRSATTTDFAGVRSFGFVAFLGAAMQFADQLFGSFVLFTILGLILVAVFVNIEYVFHVFRKEQHSPASEIAVILVYFLWVLVFLDQKEIAIIFAIFISGVISSKERLHSVMQKISREEINTTLKFAAIAFVILPLLPDVKYSFASLLSAIGLAEANLITMPIWTMKFFNPHSLWFFVVVMSGISYIGYILTRMFGDKSGILASCVMGGMISSTAVTASMSEESKKHPHNSSLYTTGALLASGVMFLRVMAIITFTYSALLAAVFIPAFIMFSVFMALTWYFFLTSKKQAVQEVHIEEKVQSPFQIAPAIKFALFILMIKFIAALWIAYKDLIPQELFYYGLAIISGLADVDAITQTMSGNAKSWELASVIAGTTILIAVMSNNLVKGSLAFRFWEKMFGRKVLTTFVASMIAGLITIFVL